MRCLDLRCLERSNCRLSADEKHHVFTCRACGEVTKLNRETAELEDNDGNVLELAGGPRDLVGNRATASAGGDK